MVDQHVVRMLPPQTRCHQPPQTEHCIRPSHSSNLDPPAALRGKAQTKHIRPPRLSDACERELRFSTFTQLRRPSSSLHSPTAGPKLKAGKTCPFLHWSAGSALRAKVRWDGDSDCHTSSTKFSRTRLDRMPVTSASFSVEIPLQFSRQPAVSLLR
ncbi:hypothetical protein NQZ68_040296 [Dissostichus eleginoides]|nr:hypothetical protein NQZ68_040296 [Dissostichus eleginoides]